MIEDEDKAILRKQRKAAKLEKAQYDKALRGLLAQPEGRKYLWWLLSLGRLGHNPHTNNALSTAFNCGELNVSQQVLAHIIEVDPAGYVRMMQEQANARGNPSDYGNTPDDRDSDDDYGNPADF